MLPCCVLRHSFSWLCWLCRRGSRGQQPSNTDPQPPSGYFSSWYPPSPPTAPNHSQGMFARKLEPFRKLELCFESCCSSFSYPASIGCQLTILKRLPVIGINFSCLF